VCPDQQDQFQECIKLDQTESIKTEPACLQFLVGEDITARTACCFHKECNDEADFQAHTKTPHCAKWQSFCDTQPWSNKDGPQVKHGYGTNEIQKFKTLNDGYLLECQSLSKEEV